MESDNFEIRYTEPWLRKPLKRVSYPGLRRLWRFFRNRESMALEGISLVSDCKNPDEAISSILQTLARYYQDVNLQFEVAVPTTDKQIKVLYTYGLDEDRRGRLPQGVVFG